MEKSKILIIEDDSDIREGIHILLESEDYEIYEAETGEKGLKMLNDDLSLIILDIMMPGISGLTVCKEIRKKSYVPILFLTAKVQESDKLIALMAGGDDYLTKPFSYSELLGRVRALIRRYTVYENKVKISAETKINSYIEYGNIRIHKDFNEVWVNGRDVDLTNTEYNILLLMMTYKGKIFSAQNLYESIWNEPYFYNCNSTIMVHIRNLRTKIEVDAQNPTHIKTVWGKGYRFED